MGKNDLKKYIAQYREVAGEVIPGDTYFQSYLPNQVGIANRRDYMDGAYKEHRKCELFLLSIPDLRMIGQISPDATYVKDNMELTSEEIYGGTRILFFNDRLDMCCSNNSGDYAKFKYIKIKGPCGHFH